MCTGPIGVVAGKVLEFFRKIDTSGDGAVNRGEFRAAMTLMGLELPRADVDALFKDWDPDNDGALRYTSEQLGA